MMISLIHGGGAQLGKEDPQIILVHRMARGLGEAGTAWKAQLAGRGAGISAVPVLFPSFSPF